MVTKPQVGLNKAQIDDLFNALALDKHVRMTIYGYGDRGFRVKNLRSDDEEANWHLILKNGAIFNTKDVDPDRLYVLEPVKLFGCVGK